MSLHLSDNLKLHLKYLQHRTVFLGGSGAGKTAGGRRLFEQATEAGVLCGAIDLKADWWGLKSTADGKGPGIPVVILGGEHQDLPLDPDGGAVTADILCDLRQPFVLDLEQFSRTKQIRFLGAFLDRLYDRNRDPLVLFLDEADRYAPQKPMSPEANLSLGAAEDLVKRGRKHGIFPVVITQRNASLNKNVSELCEIAWIFRTTGPHDQDAVRDWLSVNATKEQRDDVMGRLSGLPTGTAILCCAHPQLKIFQTVPLTLPTTFDSSATPEIGRRRIEPKQLATPDLAQLRSRMAATIEKAKAEDPRELRKTVAHLQQDNRKLTAELEKKKAPKIETKTKNVPVLTAKEGRHLERLAKTLRDDRQDLAERIKDCQMQVREIDGLVGRIETLLTPKVSNPVQPSLQNRPQNFTKPAQPDALLQSSRPSSNPVQTSAVTEGALSQMARRILIVLAQHPEGLTKGQILVHADYRSSGKVSSAFAALLRDGWVESIGTAALKITATGLTGLGPFEVLPTGQALQAYLLQSPKLNHMEKQLLAAICQAYPGAIAKNAVLEQTGYASSGKVSSAFAKLVKCQWVRSSGPSLLTASPELFD